MLESVLADVLTRVLGQYLQGIDRDHVNFGAWSGRIELRSVALRPEALAVLFETLGVALPVTVESGFIGLLRLVVPWKSIGSTPVQVYMHDVTIVARPVRGDGSDDSQLHVRDRRIKRAKLNTDDAVREAAWGVSSEPDQPSKSSWSSWLVSDQLRATIINNIQIHLSDIIIRFEDPYSNSQSPYVASMHCESLKIVSADNNWREAFVEDSEQKHIRKLLEVEGFRVNWAPITANNSSDASNCGDSSASLSFDNHDLLREYVTSSADEDVAHPSPSAPRNLIHRIDGSIRLCLSPTGPSLSDVDFRAQEPSADLDIVLPNIVVDMNDVQYACLTQTSLYFARIATRGFRPSTPKSRWKWAVDQLLPGCTARFARASRFTSDGLKETRHQRDAYIVNRTSILKARRSKLDEPKQIVIEIERMEDNISFDEILAYRDAVDSQIEKEGHLWIQETKDQVPSEVNNRGTTTSSFWSMLGYNDSPSTSEKAQTPKLQKQLTKSQDQSQHATNLSQSSTMSDTSDQKVSTSLTLRAAFLLQSATLRMSERGYPTSPIPRVELRLRDFRIGVMYSSAGDLIVEALLGTVEAWNLRKNTRMAYSRLATLDDFPILGGNSGRTQHSYPRNVPEAIESIRSGSNPAEELLEEGVEMEQELESRTSTEDFFADSDASLEESAEDAEDSSDKLSLRSRKPGSGGSRPTYRVTSREFLGGSNCRTVGKHVAAFRYSQLVDHGELSKQIASLEISVATMETIVDGPKGSFLWGLKFWQPKGLVQDPIMAFLGAAAGARIAELRIELEQALLAKSVPLQVDAVILAPRFVIPSSIPTAPAIVVNMGTLGICTSDSSALVHGLSANAEPSHLRYSNYVLTLDDLGVYFSPDFPTAVPRMNSKREPNMVESLQSGEPQSANSMGEVERIIRPFSLHFVLQTLRDPNAVQVAQSASAEDTALGDGIAKLRVRGNIPDLSLILTQKAFQHILATAQGWSEGLKPSVSSSDSSSLSDPRAKAWENVGEDGVAPAPSQEVIDGVNALTSVISPPKDVDDDKASSTRTSLPILASYNVKIVVDLISIEFREDMNIRLVTATASKFCASVSKRTKSNLRANVALGNWSITDGSRGSTAPFRRLLYSGSLSPDKDFPTHSPSRYIKHSQLSSKARENFVNIRYDLDLTSHEQKLNFHFLSLHMNCVRESFLRLLSFFDRVRKYVSQRRRRRRQQIQSSDFRKESENKNATTEISAPSIEPPTEMVTRGSPKVSVQSEFDGFSIQLVASKGVVAVFEVKNSDINFILESNATKKAYGKFGSFSIRDLTAPLKEHVTVLHYERIRPLLENVEELDDGSQALSMSKEDRWDFQFPSDCSESYHLKASFKGIKLLVLYRFIQVLQDYVSAFVERATPAFSSFVEDAKAEYPVSEKLMSPATYSAITSKILVSIDLKNTSLRIPRHSSCLSEAISFVVGKLHIDNSKTRKNTALIANMDDIQGTVQFILAHDKEMGSETSASSAFLTDGCLELSIKAGERSNMSATSADILKIASVQFQRPLRINLTEAQYTVLYFVLTENIAETISSDDVSVSLDDVQDSTHKTECDTEQFSAELDKSSEEMLGKSSKSLLASSVKKGNDSAVVDPDICERISAVKVEVVVPLFDLEILRGWDVAQGSHRVLGVYLANVICSLTVYTPRRLLLELAGTLLSISDLRQEANPPGHNMIVRLSPCDPVENDVKAISVDNILVTYDKKGVERPSIIVALDNLQVELIPELLRDLTCLAIPGWPFLKTTAFGPEVEYVGRIVTLALKNSQIILVSEASASDKGTLVLTGEFEMKMDWKRKTGGKTILMQSRGLEVSAIGKVPSLRKICSHDESRDNYLYATSLGTSSSPLIYPTNGSIEFVSPIVDDAGRRMNISMDALLCVVCTSEIPILKAILRRLSSVKESHLSGRQWSQPMIRPDAYQEVVDSKETQKRKARESLIFSMNVPVSRYLVTDDSEGRFVPIVEMRFSSFSVESHGSDMFQVGSRVSVDLFNPTKGWWEPVLEPWNISASLSRGQSGTQALILKSEERLNLNVAPTTISTAKAVAKVLRDATQNTRGTENSYLPEQNFSDKEGIIMHSTVRRPTVAAFLVRNELGYPIMLNVSGRSKWTTIASNCEMEVGAQSEAIISSSDEGKRSREDILQCFISIPSFMPKTLSAAEAGKYPVTFFPKNVSHGLRQNFSKADSSINPIEVLWDVELKNGVPVCTLRSPFRILNDTMLALDVLITNAEEVSEMSLNSANAAVSLSPGEHFPIPINDMNGKIFVRPALSTSKDAKLDVTNVERSFQWSTAFPRLPWLLTLAQEKALVNGQSDTRSTRRGPGKIPLIECKQCENNDYGLFFKLIPSTSEIKDGRAHIPWLDISVKAPVSFANKLPGRLLYRVYNKNWTSSGTTDDDESAIFAAGTINAYQRVDLHFSDESFSRSFLSVAFDNGINHNLSGSTSQMETLLKFGPSICLRDIEVGKLNAIYPSPVGPEDGHSQSRKRFRVNVNILQNEVSEFVFFAGAWVRNRSDVTIEVCSRQSFYNSGSVPIILREKPPFEAPDNYVCIEGPYLSVRLNKKCGVDKQESMQLDWWTSPSILEDIDKPITFCLPGRSLELEVRPSIGLECQTLIVTIRNLSWIINSTSSLIQWCQQTSLDAHGNCPKRLLNSIRPGEVQGLHWSPKSHYRALHLRIADTNESSDWIWSPPIPLDVGHSRELPAKMYRPKTHDQYIARVGSKEIAGSSRVLVVYEEDRQNPPYRIVNMCKERALAFSQIGSHDRPWLVRAGKSTRYSWDDPLAPPNRRELNIRVLEKEELMGKISPNAARNSQRSGGGTRSASANLNIDKVGDRVLVLNATYEPSVVFNVTVDGATKIITLFDEGSELDIPLFSQAQTSTSSLNPDGTATLSKKKASVPVVGWEDMDSHSSSSNSTEKNMSDYPSLPSKGALSSSIEDVSKTDVAVFMDSIGISVIDNSPEEIMYFTMSGLFLNYEASKEEQNVLVTIEHFQIDNQMVKTPYPVMLWVPISENESDASESADKGNVTANALTIELHRDIGKQDIIMVRTFRALLRPFSICFEEGLINKVLQFLGDSTLSGESLNIEKLGGFDDECQLFISLIPGSSTEKSGRQEGSISSSRRIYVHNFQIAPTTVQLTSSGNGAAIAKAAGLGASARAVIGLLMNVENCQFEFSSLCVQNAFDSLHHFVVLVRTYYVTQLSNQRLKLIASNSLVGNPAALFDAVGTGARDFFAEPGRAKGSVDFFASVGRGSKSLFAHTVGGLVQSVSSIPLAMSSGIERAVGDNNYIAERDRIRGSTLLSGQRGKSKNPAQGIATGALSLAHGISSGVTGFIRDPVQGAKEGGAGGLLKGIGKAFIGGVAKPVAGVMDFVAEPVAGLSRQIVDVEPFKGTKVAAPSRAPRAFKGKSQRIDQYDRSYSIGAWILKATSMASGVDICSNLIDWVELSNRPGRNQKDADLWIWYVVQRFSRCMPGAKKALRSEMKRLGYDQSSDSQQEARLEKTRVALLTNEDIVIVTLDCKLVSTIPIWSDAIFEIVANDNELIVGATIINSSPTREAGDFDLLQGTQALIQAPWDVASARRRKPAVGESTVDHILCGSAEACEDLRLLLTNIIKQKESLKDDCEHQNMALSDPMASGQELSEISERHGNGDLEMRMPRPREDRKMRMGGDRSGLMNTVDKPERTLESLKKAVKRLSTNSGMRRAKSSTRLLKIIIANELSDDVELRLKEGSLENGEWRKDAPVLIRSLDAEDMEIDESSSKDKEHAVYGNVVYKVVEVTGESELGQVMVEFFWEKDAATSFTTKASKGFRIEFERGGTSHGTVVFKLRRSVEGESEPGRASFVNDQDGTSEERNMDESEGGRNAGTSAMSKDEKLLQQLLDIGFTYENSIEALAEANGDIVRAVDLLTK